MVRYHVGPIETLRDAVRAQRFLWVLCLKCGRSKRLDPRPLAMVWGAVTLRDIKLKLRCQRCHARRAAIIPDDEEMPGRN